MTPIHRNDDEGGMALVAALLISFMIVLFSIVVVATATANQAQSSRIQERTGLRAQAETGLDDVFSRLRTRPNYLDPAADSPSINGDTIKDHLAYNAPGVKATKWARFNNGVLTACNADARIDNGCFAVTVVGGEVHDLASNEDDNRNATVEAVARSRCRDAAGVYCEFNRLQQRLQRRSYFDFLYLTDLETLDPRPEIYPGAIPVPGNCSAPFPKPPVQPGRDLACLNPAYQADSATDRDTIDGPIHTNDLHVFVCGKDLRFTHRVESTDNIRVLRNAVGNGCVDSDGDIGLAAGSLLRPSSRVIPLPSPEAVKARFQPLARDAERIAKGGAAITDATDNDTAPNYSSTGDQRILLEPTCVRITPAAAGADTGTCVPFPDSKVIFVNGNVTSLRGTLDGQLTIAAFHDSGGHIDISGNLSYANPDPDTTDDALGLIATDSVRILYPGAAEPSRTVHAAIISRSVYVPNWDTNTRITAPVLNFVGTMATTYRGAFGGYLIGSGMLETGYRKAFIFDERFRDRQPPYFLDSAAAAWERVDVGEVTARNGLIKQ